MTTPIDGTAADNGGFESPSGGAAQILDRGHRAYDGPRTGTKGAMRSVVIATIQRALGLHRGALAKAGPVIVVAITFIPAIAYVGFAVLAKDLLREVTAFGIDDVGRLTPSYASFYGTIGFGIIIFSILVAPDVLCSDRRSRILGLYLAAPLNRTSYLIAKAIGVASVLALVTLGPPLLYLVGLTLSDLGPDGPVEWFTTFGRVLLAGAAVASMQTALSLSVSSFTDRSRVAAAAVAGLLIGSTSVAAASVEGAGLDRRFALIDFSNLPVDMVHVIFDERVPSGVDPWLVTGAWAGWTLLFCAVLWWRYQRLDVTK